jgi:hypothetical protein
MGDDILLNDFFCYSVRQGRYEIRTKSKISCGGNEPDTDLIRFFDPADISGSYFVNTHLLI